MDEEKKKTSLFVGGNAYYNNGWWAINLVWLFLAQTDRQAREEGEKVIDK